ncbi:MAG: FKBP-type peptidyl-prolyl cis-trans isomerase N-terminal domain-containing protein [Akkermansia sp.]|nr:FKBP-type peptidyl-prolyl cis-trans isomerase N-terminal domain-containing protein [Akkermansia sp.]
MKAYIIPLIVACSLLHAQEMPQQVRQDLSKHHGLLFAARVHTMQEQLGSAFVTEDFLKQLDDALQKKSIAKPKTLAEAMAAGLREDGLEARDFDNALLMKHLNKMLAELPKMKEKDVEKKLVNQSRKLARQVIPILQQREAAKEKRVLELNARRSGVTTLPNGVQMEVQPGSGSIRAVNRIMVEEGISDPERTTTQCSVDDLPEAVQRMLDQVPAGSAWTFWIPAEVTDAIAREGEDSKEEEADREALMDQLAGGNRRKSFNTLQREREERERAQEDDGFPAPRTTLQKITVWQDAAEAPIRPFSHSTQTQNAK